MKKIYSLALMAFIGAAVANAQALKLDKNYVIYTEHDGTTSMAEALSETFIDDDYNVFPVKGGTLSPTIHKLTQDYKDEETGVEFKAGEYSFVSTGTEISFSNDSDFPQGLSNVKKVIYYVGGVGSLKVIGRMYQNDADGNGFGISYEHEPETNRGWNTYVCKDIEYADTKYDDNGNITSADDSYLTYSSPIKLTVDLTNNEEGTDEEISGNKLNVNTNDNWFAATSGKWFTGYNKEAENPTEKRMLFQFFEQGLNDDGQPNVGVKGEKKIAWDAANRYWTQFKSYGGSTAPAYLMAVAFICGDENAETFTIRMKADDETGISNVVANGSAKSNEMYNLAGQRIAAPVGGQIYIQNGKKYIAK